jgi:membrane-associated phospholipid phosphatase
MARILNNAPNNTIAGLADRIKTELALKLGLLVILYPLVFLPYFFLQRHHFFPATTISSGWFDRLIPFSDQAVWPYFSIYLLLPVGPLFMDRRYQLLHYAAGVALLSLIADLIFLCWPTACPRPHVAGVNTVYGLLIAVDSSFNAFPSLHAAFAVYSALCAGLVLRELGSHRVWRLGIWFWAFLILYATLATRQHVVVDVIAGSVIGAAAYATVLAPRISIFKNQMPLQAVAIDLNQPPSNIK